MPNRNYRFSIKLSLQNKSHFSIFLVDYKRRIICQSTAEKHEESTKLREPFLYLTEYKQNYKKKDE